MKNRKKKKPDLTSPHRHYESTLYLNLYDKHFSYIKDLARYSKSFCCSRCGKYGKGANKLRRHEKTCDGKVKLKYPGGAYHVPKTIFEELEDEGILVPEEARCFPYRATFELRSITSDHCEGQHLTNDSSCCTHIYSYSCIWLRVGTRK